jgi:hypothetical protein
VKVERLIHRHPVLYHMAEGGSWESVRRSGLLSTSALLDKFEIEGERRFVLESSRRREVVSIEHLEHGTAVIRDNKPMQEKALRRCLIGMSPREWYEHLNRRVFFWVEQRRLLKLLNARAYRERPHLVLEVDASALLRRHADRVTLSPINSGATFVMNPAPRGPDTFRRIADHRDDRPVAELAVDYAVPDIADFTLSVSRWRGSERIEVVYEAATFDGRSSRRLDSAP